jgi:hypothetical protein
MLCHVILDEGFISHVFCYTRIFLYAYAISKVDKKKKHNILWSSVLKVAKWPQMSKNDNKVVLTLT